MSVAVRARVRAQVEGVVQGVGFRPFVYRLAREHALGGWVRNDSQGVLLEVEGETAAVERFLARLSVEAPPLAAIARVSARTLGPTGEQEFSILRSAAGGTAAEVSVGPDAAPCEECLRELFDPRDRRHRYPFVNCTDCGPRFTILRDVPYDRPQTTMAGFAMCAECRAEYEDPASRRFHAQPNACPTCGPSLRLLGAGGTTQASGTARAVETTRAGGTQAGEDAIATGEDATATGESALAAAVEALSAGRIVALKGAGGYHLACRADDEGAVRELRRRKRRAEKPLALMAADLDAALELVQLSDSERRLLSAPERPIVIARRREQAPVAAAVAPGYADLGVMLPSTPLHHLLLADVGTTLVMSSGNVSEEPIAYRDEDAAQRLDGIADLVLAHDRPIHVRADDSVVRALHPAAASHPLLLRRSRGRVPAAIELPLQAPPLLACGAELGSTFCVARGRRAWVGQHIGDLRNWETLQAFREGIAHFQRLFDVRPAIVAHDLHPDYLSSAYALQRDDAEPLAVQHHHAHFAACLAEHGLTGPAVGAIYDGSGLGADGTIWGGELLAGDLARVTRVGSLHPVALPGGDAAVREPWRMACAWMLAASDDEASASTLGAGLPAPPPPATIAGRIDERRWRQVAELARTGTAAPTTTSAGRLFDAVAALCGIRLAVHDEGRAAIELEAAAALDEPGAYPLPVLAGEPLRMDARETIRAILADLGGGVPAAIVSARFHNGLADATAGALTLLADRLGLESAVLSGGVFQNRLLLERTATALRRAGLRVLIPRRLPPNDGAIAYGQAAVAAALLSDPSARASPSTASASGATAAATARERPAPASKPAPSRP
ncbi:MAG TPA: carbamoyltransferase HypF [Solirubrobacteraceae bacterium]|nr:carbamoyltransferase HypF [Solirubrobacteraceae bacterium]